MKSLVCQAITKAKMPKTAQENAFRKKIEINEPDVRRGYSGKKLFGLMTELPWSKTKINSDLSSAQKILDEDHYGLEKVKERIIEF